MADKNLEMLLRIIAQVDGLRDVEGLRESVETLDPALSTLAARARAMLNPMDGLANSARNFGASIKETTQPLADLATNALKVTSVVAALATALGGAVYQEAKKFESAQLDLKKVLGGTQEELDIYGQKLNSLALEFGVSSNALTASMAEFVQAGFSAGDSLDLVRQSLKLKVAGDLEAAQSSEYLVKMLKGFGEEAVNSSRYVDVLNEVSNRYATDVKQLAEGMSRVAPISKQMGLSFEETAGALTPMIESFGSGAEAAEAFKTGVLKLIDDSKPVKDALLSMGIAQTDLNGNLRSGKDILNDVMVAFQTTGKEQKLYLTSQLVGIDQAPRMIEAFDNLNKVLGIQKAGLEAVASEHRKLGSAQEEVNIRLQSAETIAARSSESFRQLAVALGTNYRDEVKGVVDATGALARGFLDAEKAGSMDGLFAAVKPQLEAVENLFRQMAANLPAAFAGMNWGPLTSAITDLGGEVSQAFSAFMGSIDLTTVDGLRQAMQLIADSMAALIRFTAGAVDQMSPFFEAMGTAARFAAENADSISRLAGEVAGFSLTVNKLIPLLADMAAGTFSIIGMAADAAFTIGLVVGAIKLLNLAGISVLPMLGSLATAIGGLGVGTATLGAAFLGIPGAMLAVAGAAGAVGVATYSATRAIADMTGDSWSLGSAIYDLAEALGLENTEADKARIINEATAKAREAQAAAAKKQADAEKELALAAERARKAAEYQTETALATDKANRKLAEGFQAAGLIWDKATGELVRVSDAMSGIAPASLTVKNALRELGVDYAAFSGGISEGAEKAVLAFKKITQDVTANAPVIAAALQKAVNKAETIGDLEAIQAAFNEFTKTGKLSSEQVAAGQAAVAEKMQQVRAAMDPLLALHARYLELAGKIAAASSDAADAAVREAQATLTLAKAKGDEAAIARATVDLKDREKQASEAVVTAYAAELEILKNKRQQFIETAGGIEKMTAAQRLELLQLDTLIGSKKTDIATTNEQIEAKEREKKQAEIMAGPIGELSRLYAEQAKEHERAGEASNRYQALQTKEAEGALALAKIKGDQQEIDKAQAALDDQKIAQAQALAATRQQEAIDAENAVSAKVLEMAADKEWTAADQEVEAQLRATAAAKRDAATESQNAADQLVKETQANREVAEATQKAAEAAKNAKEAEEARTSAGKAAAKTMNDGLALLEATGGEMDKLTKRFYEQQGAITANAAGWDGWAAGTARAAQEVKQAYENQKAAVDGMTGALEQFNETGIYNTQVQQAMIQSGGDLVSQYDLMDQQSLDNLRGALDSANDKLREMQNEAQDARDQLAELNAELAAERGDTDTADRLKLELEQRQALADLERRIQDAEMQGNRELVAILEEQRRKLEELYAIKERNLEQDIRSRRQQEESNSKSASSGGGGNNNSSTVTSGSSTGGGLSNRSNAFSLTVNTTGGIIDSNFADELARKLKPKLDEISRRSL